MATPAPLEALLPAQPLWVWSADPSTREAPAAERAAFERRMGDAWPRVVRLVERLLAWPGSAAEVEDVAQEVFLAAWRGRGAFRGEAEWTTWVHTIAVRRARNAARARRRRERWFGRTMPAEGLDGLGSGPEANAADGDGSAVRLALARLRHPDREILVLRYLEALGVDEIGARLELGRAAVDARLSRARSRLRSMMDGGGARS